MANLSICGENDYADWFYEFLNQNDSFGNKYLEDISDGYLEIQVNDILKDIGKIYFANVEYGNEYIEFYSEEDMINFILKYSS